MVEEGLVFKFKGDATSLERSAGNATDALGAVDSALKKLTGGLKGYGDGMGGVSDKQTQAARSANALKDAVAKVKKPTGDATNALTNLSRVAQDAPYGFIGIANNLNPLLESFQRLEKETGSMKGALKSLGTGLIGPGGVGLALGVISSLVVAFGDKLFSAGEKAKYLRDDLRNMADEFASASSAIKNSADAVQFLNSISAIRVQIRGGDTEDVIKRQVYSLKAAIQQLEEGEVYLAQKAKEVITRIAEAPGGSDESKQAEAAFAEVSKAQNASIAQRAEYGKQIVTLEEQLTLEQVNKAKDRAKKLKEELSKEQFNFFDSFFKAHPQASEVEKQFHDMAKVAREFASKHFNLFEGLDPVLFAPSERQTIAAGRIFWDNFRRGIVKLKPPKLLPEDLLLFPDITAPVMQDPGKVLGSPLEDLGGVDIPRTKEQILADFAIIFRQLKSDLPTLIERINPVTGLTETISVEAVINTADLIKGLLAGRDKIVQAKEEFARSINQAFVNTFQSLSANLGKGLGAAIAGDTDGIQAAGDAMVGIIAGLIEQIGEALIQFGIVKSGLDKILLGGINIPGVAALAAGVSAIAIAQLVRSIQPRAFADGGIAYGPTLGLMGEYSNASTNPEVIAPLSKLRGMIADVAGGAGGGILRARGNDLVLVQARTERSQRRGG